MHVELTNAAHSTKITDAEGIKATCPIVEWQLGVAGSQACNLVAGYIWTSPWCSVSLSLLIWEMGIITVDTSQGRWWLKTVCPSAQHRSDLQQDPTWCLWPNHYFLPRGPSLRYSFPLPPFPLCLILGLTQKVDTGYVGAQSTFTKCVFGYQINNWGSKNISFTTSETDILYQFCIADMELTYWKL